MRLVHLFPKTAFINEASTYISKISLIYEARSTMQHRNKDSTVKLKTNSLQVQLHHHNPPQK